MDTNPSISPDLLTDSATELPHPIVLIPALETRLSNDGSLGLVVVTILGLDPIEQEHGQAAFDRIIKEASGVLASLRGSIIRQDDLIAMSETGGSSFMVFLGEPRNAGKDEFLQKEDVARVAERIYENVFPRLCATFFAFTKKQPKLAVGYSLVVHNPLISVRRLINRLIDEARDMARLNRPLSTIRHKEWLQKIILTEGIRTVFQPICHVHSRSIMGYEALTRGPAGTLFESPLSLFTTAAEVGLSFELDRLCRLKAIASSKLLPDGSKIFINTLPNTIQDPELLGERLTALLRGTGKTPENFVLEINERVAIENFETFRTTIQPYLDLGMSIAIDDAGTGYSSLEAIVELKPRYLKSDLSIVRGIHLSPIKQEMLKMLCVLADKTNSIVIVEGVEQPEEAEVLAQMNIPFAQGYYYARPAPAEELSVIPEPAEPCPRP
jgi:EAL domain-containing protein (putative c-di-GMP-specific phosphodiesterase class I)/GGDEF domain-containing protein